MAFTDTTIDNPDGTSFKALAPENCLGVDPTSSPRLLFYPTGWIYTVGVKPAVLAPYAKVSADASRVVVHDVTPASGVRQHIRFILQDGNKASVVLLSDTSRSENIAVGKYVDVKQMSDGSYQFSAVDDFDPNNTPGSAGIISAINTEKANRNIP